MDDALRKLQLVELDILKKTLHFFEENNISYFALGGTLLGAVRHKGFIPWDDDIDLGVPREDFERLLKLLKNNTAGLEMRSIPTHENYFSLMLKIVDPSVHVITNRAVVESGEAWVDIFPLDGMPNNCFLRKLHELRVLYRRALFGRAISSYVGKVHKKRPLFEKLVVRSFDLIKLEKLLDYRKEFLKLDHTLKLFPYAKSDYLVNGVGIYRFREMFHKKYYGEGRMYQFEDIQIRGPEDYDFVLTQLYGDYMTPPAENDPGRNHHYLVDIIFDEDETS